MNLNLGAFASGAAQGLTTTSRFLRDQEETASLREDREFKRREREREQAIRDAQAQASQDPNSVAPDPNSVTPVGVAPDVAPADGSVTGSPSGAAPPIVQAAAGGLSADATPEASKIRRQRAAYEKFGQTDKANALRETERQQALTDDIQKLSADYETRRTSGNARDPVKEAENMASAITQLRFKHGYATADDLTKLSENYKKADTEGINQAMRLFMEGKDADGIKAFQDNGKLKIDDPAAVKVTRYNRSVGGQPMPDVVVEGTSGGKPFKFSRWDLLMRTVPPEKQAEMAKELSASEKSLAEAAYARAGKGKLTGEKRDQNEEAAYRRAESSWGSKLNDSTFSFEGENAQYAARNARLATQIYRNMPPDRADLNAAHEIALTQVRGEKMRDEMTGNLPGIEKKSKPGFFTSDSAAKVEDVSQTARSMAQLYPIPALRNENEMRTFMGKHGVADTATQDQVFSMMQNQTPQQVPARVPSASSGLTPRPSPVAARSAAPAAPAQPQGATGSSQASADMPPPQAFVGLKEGVQRKFGNGQVWTVTNGQPFRIQ